MKTDKEADRGGGLWSKLTAVTPSPQATAAVAFAMVLVVSGVGPFAGLGGMVPTDHDGVASAAQGDEEWSFSAGDRIYPSSPTVVDGTVYVGSDDNNLYAIDASTGNEEWSYTTGSSIKSSPNVVDGTVYVGSNDGNLYAIDASTGNEEWSYAANGDVYSSPTVAGDTVYVGSDDNNLYAIDASTGTEEWNYSTNGMVQSSPTVVDGTVYVGSDDNNLYAIDASTGAEEWSYTATDTIRSSPTVSDGTVYVGSDDNNIYAIDASTGSEEWNYTAGSRVTSSPTVANGTVYVGSWDDSLYAIDASTGTEDWSYATGNNIRHSSPTVAGGTVYVGSDDNSLYAIDASTGAEEWSYATNDIIWSSPTVSDGTVYVPSADNNLYALDTGHTQSSEDTRVLGGTLGHTDDFSADGTTTLGHPITGAVTNESGEPVDGATVSTGTGASTTTASDGSYELTVSETGTYDVTASARGYQDTTETVDVPDGGTTQNFSLTESDAPFVGSFNPNDGASLETSQVSIEAELRSHDGHDLNYTIYHRDTESADNFTALKTGQVADGTVVSTTVSDASGTNEWFVRLSDGTTTTDTEVFNYTAPGSLSFYDRETESLINDREITVEMRPAFGSWEGTTLTTTDGVVNFDDVDRDAGKVWAVFMNTTGYNSTFWTLSDVEHNHNVMLRPKGSNIETFNQTFALDDETGDYPPRTSTIELEQYYLGEYQRQDIDNFGQENRANLTVEPNTTYRIKVYNTNGNYRVLGEYNSSNANRDGVITVHVNPIEEVADRFPPGNEDETDGWEDSDDYNSPPVADFSSNPLDPTIGESVSFDGSLSADFDGSISSYEWQFGDGTTATGASVSHSYGSAGTYTVELTVTDDAGLKSTTSRTIYVAEDSSSTRLPPTAEFATAPAEPNVSEVVNLDASASTSDAGSIASVEWDLNGNGEFTESGTSIDHKFETSGFKRVCVRVTDDAGVSSETCDTLVVFDDSPPGNASEGSFSGGGGGGGIGGGPVDDPTGGNPLLVGGVLVGVSLLIARRTGNLSKITGAASGLLRAGVSGVRRLVGVVRR